MPDPHNLTSLLHRRLRRGTQGRSWGWQPVLPPRASCAPSPRTSRRASGTSRPVPAYQVRLLRPEAKRQAEFSFTPNFHTLHTRRYHNIILFLPPFPLASSFFPLTDTSSSPLGSLPGAQGRSAGCRLFTRWGLGHHRRLRHCEGMGSPHREGNTNLQGCIPWSSRGTKPCCTPSSRLPALKTSPSDPLISTQALK